MFWRTRTINININLNGDTMTIADDIAQIKADVAAIKAAPPPVPTVDLSAVLAADAAIQTTVNDIDAKLTLTPPTA